MLFIPIKNDNQYPMSDSSVHGDGKVFRHECAGSMQIKVSIWHDFTRAQ